ncbi:MAG TPA: Ig-like domain-containing protein [Terracidiphilus sp.]
MKRFSLFLLPLLLIAGCTSAGVVSNPLTSIAISPNSASINTGSTIQFAVTGTFQDGSTKDVSALATWSSSSASVASISASGLVTGVASGTSTITATENGLTATADVTVRSSTATLVSIAVTPRTAIISAGANQQFVATGTYSDGSTQTITSSVTWTSSSTSIATIATSGLATGVAAGTSTVTATLGTVSGTASLTVSSSGVTLTSISVTPSTASISAGTTKQFTATGNYSDGSTQTLTTSVTWTSGTTSVATIASSGLATGVAVGSSTITATLGTVSGTATITVTPPGVTLTSITVTPATASVVAGSAQQFTATGNYSDGSTQSLTSSATWTSSITAVATVNASGLATGIGAGATTISASLGSVSGSAVLTVTTNTTASAGCDGAGNCYIYAGATGAGTGTSWANAYTGFGTGSGKVNPASMQRGVTYWIAAGSYGAQNFTTPVSGTEIITIEGATPTSHGPASDWDASYAGTAVFGGGTTGVFSNYWVFEGQTRGSDWQSGYSIMFDLNGVSGKGGVITNRNSSGNAFSNLFFDNVEIRGSNMNMTYNSGQSSNCSTYCDGGFYTGSPTNNLYVGHSWIHDVGDTQFQSNINDSSLNSNGSNWIIEYNYISRDHTGDQSNGAHSEAFSSTVQNMVVRYNYFQDILSSGVITDATGGNPDVGPWYVYGNIVFWADNANMYSGAGSTSSGLGDGFVSFFGGTLHGTNYIVHNTIANLGVQPHCAQSGVACAMYFLYASGSGSGSWIIENNLVWNAHGSCVYNGGASWTIAADYNSIYGGTAGTMSNCGTHAQTVSNTNPFVNWDGSGTQLVPFESLDFSLAADTTAGDNSFANLPAGCTPGVNCMNVDMTGKVFGSTGLYERGALQK